MEKQFFEFFSQIPEGGGGAAKKRENDYTLSFFFLSYK